MAIKKTKKVNDIPNDILGFFQRIETKELISRKKEMVELDLFESRLKNDLKHCEEQREDLTAHLKELEARKTKEVEMSERLLERLGKHVSFESVKVAGSGSSERIEITTKLLFSKIRLSEGERKTERTCLGAYKIQMFPSNPGRVKASNLTYSGRSHWATNEDVVCLGDWSEDYRNAISRNDFYTAFEAICMLLTDATLDGSAYIRSHVWKQKRMLQIQNTETSANRGDPVMAIEREWDGLEFLGCVGVYRSDEEETGLCHVQFRRVGDRRNWDWWLPKTMVIKIPTAMYHAAEKYEITASVSEQSKVMEESDTLLDGSTQEDINGLYKKYEVQDNKIDLAELMKQVPVVEKTIAPSVISGIGLIMGSSGL